jgi:hypothetical protein
VVLVALSRRGLWVGCVALLVLAFPAHLLFELPAALGGRPTDWRDIGHRVVLLAGGLLFGLAAPRPRLRLSRRWAQVAAVVPVLGFSTPHALWFLGVPLGIPAATLAAARDDLDVVTAVALVLAPAVGGALTLALLRPWGRRWFVVVPAGVVAVALTAYGLLGIGMMSTDLLTGATTAGELAGSWAVVLTELVFLVWGVSLGGAVLSRAAEGVRSDAAARG